MADLNSLIYEKPLVAIRRIKQETAKEKELRKNLTHYVEIFVVSKHHSLQHQLYEDRHIQLGSKSGENHATSLKEKIREN